MAIGFVLFVLILVFYSQIHVILVTRRLEYAVKNPGRQFLIN